MRSFVALIEGKLIRVCWASQTRLENEGERRKPKQAKKRAKPHEDVEGGRAADDVEVEKDEGKARKRKSPASKETPSKRRKKSPESDFEGESPVAPGEAAKTSPKPPKKGAKPRSTEPKSRRPPKHPRVAKPESESTAGSESESVKHLPKQTSADKPAPQDPFDKHIGFGHNDPSDRDPSSSPQNPVPNPTAVEAAPSPDGDESRLSSPIDEPPTSKPKRKRKSSAPADQQSKAAKSKSKSKSKSTKAAVTDVGLTPQQEEVKRLQSWLLKCGIRKMWARELGRFETDKEKVAHLKTTLRDVGMEGRFSEDKARQIKEERELKAELEAIYEGNKAWGQADDEVDAGDRVRRTRMPKGLQGLDFGDEEESE